MLKRIFLSFLISLFFCCASYANDMFSKAAREAYKDAMKAMTEAKYDKAKQLYQKSLMMGLEDDNAKKKIYNNLGIIYVSENKIGEAKEAFMSALKVEPDYKDARLNMGLLYDKMGNREEANSYWLMLLDLDRLKPKEFIKYFVDDEPFLEGCDSPLCQKVIHNNNAIIFAEEGKYNEAEQEFIKVLELDPECRIAKLNLGLLYDKARGEAANQDYWVDLFSISLDIVRPHEFIIADK